MNVCSCGMCSPIARAFTFSSLGAVLPFMMFIWCSCSEEMGFICFFSSSLILFLSSVSNLRTSYCLIFLCEPPSMPCCYLLSQSYRDCGIESIRLLGQRTETCQPIYLLISERVTNSILVTADVYHFKML